MCFRKIIWYYNVVLFKDIKKGTKFFSNRNALLWTKTMSVYGKNKYNTKSNGWKTWFSPQDKITMIIK